MRRQPSVCRHECLFFNLLKNLPKYYPFIELMGYLALGGIIRLGWSGNGPRQRAVLEFLPETEQLLVTCVIVGVVDSRLALSTRRDMHLHEILEVGLPLGLDFHPDERTDHRRAHSVRDAKSLCTSST